MAIGIRHDEGSIRPARQRGMQGRGMDMDEKPEEDVQPQEEGELTLIDPEMFYDLLMEQQEQM